MPGKRIPALPAIAGASTANDDNLVIYDTDAGETKRILRSQLAAGLVGDLPYTPSGSITATTLVTAVNELASKIRWGAGSPEGVVVANIGTLFLRLDGGAGDTFYVKESGTGNTGWAVKGSYIALE